MTKPFCILALAALLSAACATEPQVRHFETFPPEARVQDERPEPGQERLVKVIGYGCLFERVIDWRRHVSPFGQVFWSLRVEQWTASVK